MSWIIFYLASTEGGSDMKRKVDWDDEENEQSSMELSEETSETEASDEEDSSDEEPRIKDVLIPDSAGIISFFSLINTFL